jgi:hypothetical protein
LYSKNDCQHGFLLLADFLPVGQEEYPGLPGGGGDYNFGLLLKPVMKSSIDFFDFERETNSIKSNSYHE